MTPTENVIALAQSIHLAVFGRYNDVTGASLTDFINKTVDWVNQFTQELELETHWNYLRTNGNTIATIADETTQSFALPTDVRDVVINPYRDAVIRSDGTIISTFVLVKPSQISDPSDPETHDRATVIQGNLVLSRPPTENEVGGILSCDTVANMPQLTVDDDTLINLVKPKQLLVLGVAKNRSLPDLVRGGISPALAQTYKDLLDKAVRANDDTADVMYATGEDFSFVRGVF